MELWTEMIAIVAAAVSDLSQILGGSLGAAILVVSASLQVLLLPLHLWLGARRIRRSRAMARLKPELTRIQKRFKDKPERLIAETRALYRREDLDFLDFRGMVMRALPLPLLLPLYAALRGLAPLKNFLWIKDLARPDTILVGVSAALGLIGMLINAGPERLKPAAMVIGGLITVIVLARFSAGIALYWIGAQGIGLARDAWLQRRIQ